MKRPAVIEYPESVQQLKRGFDTLADLLATTLGPTQGVVLSNTELNKKPELLTDSATIARRVSELPDPRQNVGAMLLRNLVWRMHERVGDGGALAAVLAQALLGGAARSISAGANPVLVLKGMKLAAQAALERLGELRQPVRGEDDLIAVARSVTGEPDLSDILGEMFDLLGPLGHVSIEDYMAPYLERAYLDGGRWQASLISPYLINSPHTMQAVLTDVRVALYDGNITSGEELRPILDAVSQCEPTHLLLVAHKISGDALNLLVATNGQTVIKAIGVSLTRLGEKALADLEDLAWLSGAGLISPQTGRTLQSIQVQDLGKARRAEANAQHLLISGGFGEAAQVRQQIEVLGGQLRRLPIGDASRADLELRIGRLSGNVGVLKVGAYTQAERDYLHQRAGQGVKVLRAALKQGVLPGGGAAFVHCIPAVNLILSDCSQDEGMGVRTMAEALQAPCRRILQNAGIAAPGVVVHELRLAGPDCVFDSISKNLAEMRQAGILDAAKVLRAALETAVSGAAMAISTETLVLNKNPKVSYEP